MSILEMGFVNGYIVAPKNDCGTWHPMPEEFTEWINIDTLGQVSDTLRRWVHNDYEEMRHSIYLLPYDPCESPKTEVYRQRRICALTGIIQERHRTIKYSYTPKPKSDFEKVFESFSK